MLVDVNNGSVFVLKLPDCLHLRRQSQPLKTITPALSYTYWLICITPVYTTVLAAAPEPPGIASRAHRRSAQSS